MARPGGRRPPPEEVLALLRYQLSDPQADVELEIGDYLDYRRRLPEPSRADVPSAGSDSAAAVDAPTFTDYADPNVRNLSSHLRLPHLLSRTALLIEIARSSGARTYADWGAGAGRDCIALARSGLDVTHFDVAGEATDLARWRYAQRGLNVTILDVLQPPPGAFHLVSNFDCLEHLEDPVTTLGSIIGHVSPGGHLAIAVDFYNFDLADPGPHLAKNFVYGGILQLAMEAVGMERILRGTNVWVETAAATVMVWRRPARLLTPEAEITAQLRAKTTELLRQFRGFYDQEIARCERPAG